MTKLNGFLFFFEGAKTSFGMQVRQVEDYPVDLYYLMDLSLSMKDDLDNIRNLGTKLTEEMKKLTSNFRLGFGSFVDKNISPFSYTASKYQNNPCLGYKLFPNCVPSFGFRHLLSLTDKVDRFNEEVQKQMVSRNRDAPEGGFDAILQAAVCQEKIGWRKEASHLLVFTTDDVPHLALDGKLGGLVQPNDGNCHLNEKNEYGASTQMDYPSLALLGEKLAENNIHLIFAVTKSHYVLYKDFTALIPGTTVEILDQDSKNIIQLIVNAYNNIRSKVELTVSTHPGYINLAFTATCQDGLARPGLRKCGDLKTGDTVSFVWSEDQRPKGPLMAFFFFSVGSRDIVCVCVCVCACACVYRWTPPECSHCTTEVTYQCDQIPLCDFQCKTSFLGGRGSTSIAKRSHQELVSCPLLQNKILCLFKMSCYNLLCRWNECLPCCSSSCVCVDDVCSVHKGDNVSLKFLSWSHGECHCGECKCHAGYIGDNCNCSIETDTCISSDGQMCSSRGNCVCGRCQCAHPGAFGDTCEKCPTCPDACGSKRDCIECRLYSSGRLADNQTCQKLCKDEIITVDVLKTDEQDAVLCLYKTENDCVMRFTYLEHTSGKSVLTVLKEPECGSPPDAMTVLLAVVGSILLVGIALLAIWKLLVTIHDRREFARFQSERSRAKYEMASNPLYRQPISTHNVETMFNMRSKSYNGTVD
uniref:Integrin beta n=1 Tax=Latimeria chalumnae TaxID=7897 RepID=H3B689_LATCH